MEKFTTSAKNSSFSGGFGKLGSRHAKVETLGLQLKKILKYLGKK